MPVYRVQGPDGAIHRFDGPDNASPQEIEAFAAKTFGSGSPAAEPQPLSFSDSLLTSIPGRAVKGAKDFIDGGAQMLANTFGSKEEAARVTGDIVKSNADYEAARQRAGQSGFDLPRAIGSGALAMIAGRGLPVGATMAGKVGAGAATGAGFGVMQPVLDQKDGFWGEKGKQAALGAATGGAAVPVAQGLGRMISPKTAPEVKALMDSGVTPTPGQVLGGVWKSAEEKLASVPVLGAAIRSGQQRGVEQFNTAALNRVLEPVGEKMPAGVVGRDAVSHIENTLSKRYQDVLDRIGAKPVDQMLVQDMGQLAGALQQLPDAAKSQFMRVLDGEVAQRIQGGYLTGEAFKAAESNLGQIGRKMIASSDYDQQTIGRALMQARTNLRDWLGRNAGNEAADLAKVNQAWANFKVIQDAAGRVGNDAGVFTPAQLSSAVRASDKSKGKAAYAKGNALMQDLADSGRSVLMNKVPNSGTTDRALAAALTGGLGTGAVTVSPWLLAPAAASALYAPGAQRLTAGLLSSRPAGAEPLAKLVEAGSPLLGASLYSGLLGP